MPLFPKPAHVPVNSSELNRVIGDLAAIQGRIFSFVIKAVETGMSTADVAELAKRAAKDEGAQFYFKEQGFPDDISVSVNQEILNGIPRSDRILKQGETLKIAFGLHRDMNAFSTQTWTVQVGRSNGRTTALLQNTHDSLLDAIKHCVPGTKVRDLAKHLKNAVSAKGDFLSTEFAGHFIGNQPILEPKIIERSGLFQADPILLEGALISLVALAHPRKPRFGVRDDQWTTYDRNYELSACFSHMVQVTVGRPVMLTSSYPTVVERSVI